jgi:lipopolysaccharide/colanic/teichoic acid biosynthesis glycosyltransferase
LIDIVGSLIGLVLLSPLFLIIAAAIKIDSSGPVFADIPTRVGKDNKVFKMYKFRSMVKNAHRLLKKDARIYDHYKSNSFKIKTDYDPRITHIGKILRKTSIDEIPQLINILRGEMSLVGPRAFYVEELKEQQGHFPQTRELVKISLIVKPGLTGPWQVSGRSAIDFPDRVRLSAQYVKQQSILTDLGILLKTIPAVFRGEGN